MTKKQKIFFLLPTLLVLSWFILSAIFCLLHSASEEEIVNLCIGNTFLTLIVLLFSFIFRLILSLKETIYAYKNIGLIGGILFLLVFLGYLVFSINSLSSDQTMQNLLYLFLRFPSTYSLILLPVLLIVCCLIAISNLFLIRREGFRITNLLGVILGAGILVSTLGLYFVSHWLSTLLVNDGSFFYRILFSLFTCIPFFFLLLLCYFECLFIGSLCMGWVAAKTKPKYDKDYIIILGCSISKKGGLLPLLKARTNRAIKFAWEQEIATGKSVHYVPSGGQGPDEIMSEGSAMELYLLSHGAESYEVFPERASANTYQNLRNSKDLIDQLMPNAQIAFATTNYHVLRSGILARMLGFSIEGIASQTKWYFWPNGFLREFIGILSLKKKKHFLFVLLSFLLTLVLGILLL